MNQNVSQIALVNRLKFKHLALLVALDDWTDPADFGDTRELKQIIHELAEHGLLEVGR